MVLAEYALTTSVNLSQLRHKHQLLITNKTTSITATSYG